ncbi:ABC transporter substrate-binding protein [Albibacterium sp.]|uniref:ABC transporter substrate-binding protein n=1 Tax=Albibacterium sp. TaxID=2952885 RepID=UPI002C505DD1|nr:ABC transporter substrate-binding protein [Albibacterium sp.]HUH17924.1 ABC transporter substrate-binding protein [Albibacterium sp.]
MFISSCSILKPRPSAPVTPPDEKPIESELPEDDVVKPINESVNSIVLLLPFELDKIKSEPTRADVKHSEVPLDFYQGFKVALDNLVQEGYNFKLTVLDTRDNTSQNARLAVTPEVQSADLIVGPIFPKEIPVFSNAGKLTYSLQVSPLAASKPSQFNIPNLVSLVAPIDLHSEGLADYLDDIKKTNDRIIIINKLDDDSRGFLNPLKQSLTKKGVSYSEITDLNQIGDIVSTNGKNFVVLGTLDRYSVNSILARLVETQAQLGLTIELFGHPNWSKASFDSINLNLLKTKITTSYYVNTFKSNVRDFERKYIEEFRIKPSEYAYKGFDTGYFFGSLLGKYGADYPIHLTSEEYNGLQTNYRFEKNSQWGYVNSYIRILQFDGNDYVPVN